MYEGIYIIIKPTNDCEDKIKMFALSSLTAAPLCLSQHLHEIRAGVVSELGYCKMVLLNRRRCAGI